MLHKKFTIYIMIKVNKQKKIAHAKNNQNKSETVISILHKVY